LNSNLSLLNLVSVGKLTVALPETSRLKTARLRDQQTRTVSVHCPINVLVTILKRLYIWQSYNK
jgi:hypothetical protein